MRSRWLSTFTVIGVLLLALGIVGVDLGRRFVFDPGQISDGHEPWYYIIVGILMIVNGLFTPPATADEADDNPKNKNGESSKNGSGKGTAAESASAAQEV